jgi:hypothetical protein
MTIPKSRRRPTLSLAPARNLPRQIPNIVPRMTGAMKIARSGAKRLIAGVPGTVNATRGTAHGATNALQALPDSTLRWLAASSVGLGAGFYLAGAPRLVAAAGVAPALIMGAAIALRPTQPVVPAEVPELDG